MVSHVTNEVIYKKSDCIPISKHLESLQLKYYGHVVRAGITETIHNVTYSQSHITPTLNAPRRAGRPCHKWAPGMENIVSHWATAQQSPLPIPVSQRQRIIFANAKTVLAGVSLARCLRAGASLDPDRNSAAWRTVVEEQKGLKNGTLSGERYIFNTQVIEFTRTHHSIEAYQQHSHTVNATDISKHTSHA
jgi:hypothetical protein